MGEYNWFTVLRWFLLYNKANQPYVFIYLHPPPFPPASVITEHRAELCYTAASHQLSVLHTAVYICQCYTPNSFRGSKACTLDCGTPEFHQEAVARHYSVAGSTSALNLHFKSQLCPGWLSDLRKVLSLLLFLFLCKIGVIFVS